MTTTDYDPADYTRDEVLEYLKSADPDEVQRVVQLEQEGRQRVTILRAVTGEDTAPTAVVTLRHHWTDASGVAHAPGAELEVPVQVAERLVNGRYATSDQVTPDPVPVSSTDAGMVSADAAAAVGVTDTSGSTVTT